MMKLRFRQDTNTWPGFVDLFSNLVIILIFLLIVFVFLWTTTSVFNKKSGAKTIAELQQANAEQAEQIEQMTADDAEAKRLLILARNAIETIESNNAVLNDQLQTAQTNIDELITEYETKINYLQSQGSDLQQMVADLTGQLNQAKENAIAMQQQNEIATAQAAANQAAQAAQVQQMQQTLQEQLAKLQSALDAAEEKARQQEVNYVEMSNRLNKALADKVAELKDMSQYQSEFYKSVKNAVGDRTSVQRDGDRFIVSSDILFPSGSYKLSAAGKTQLQAIANVIKDFEAKIPSDIDWIIRVDGHTDKKQVVPGTHGYRNNMDLSLRRATAVVNELARAGVSRRRLVPSGFGDLHPVALGTDPASLQQNRRIELQLTNK